MLTKLWHYHGYSVKVIDETGTNSIGGKEVEAKRGPVTMRYLYANDGRFGESPSGVIIKTSKINFDIEFDNLPSKTKEISFDNYPEIEQTYEFLQEFSNLDHSFLTQCQIDINYGLGVEESVDIKNYAGRGWYSYGKCVTNSNKTKSIWIHSGSYGYTL